MSVSLYLVVYLRKNPLQRKYLFAKKFFPFDVIPQAFYSFPCNPLFVSRLVLKSIWLSRKQSWKCSLFVIISGLSSDIKKGNGWRKVHTKAGHGLWFSS